VNGPNVPEEIFDEAAIAKLAGLGKFRPNADLVVFRELLQAAAYFYFEDKHEADDNTVWQEFAALHRAAASKKFAEAHRLLEGASDRSRWLINYRAERRRSVAAAIRPHSRRRTGGLLRDFVFPAALRWTERRRPPPQKWPSINRVWMGAVCTKPGSSLQKTRGRASFPRTTTPCVAQSHGHRGSP
jgi:hypothetical protein